MNDAEYQTFLEMVADLEGPEGLRREIQRQADMDQYVLEQRVKDLDVRMVRFTHEGQEFFLPAETFLDLAGPEALTEPCERCRRDAHEKCLDIDYWWTCEEDKKRCACDCWASFHAFRYLGRTEGHRFLAITLGE